MEFHQKPCERLRDSILKVLFDKNMIKEGVSVNDMKNELPWDSMDKANEEIDSSSSDEEQEVKQEVKQEVFSDKITDESDDSDTENDTENTVSKSKKEKKPKGDKPTRAASSFVYFKSHPDTQSDIMEASLQLQGEDGKKPGAPIGQVKGAGIVWGTLSKEEKEVWKQRSHEAFKLSQNQ